MATLSIGLAATKAPWSAALRSYVRDHSQGIAVEVVMDRGGLLRATSRIDVLVMDDIMRTFSITDIARAQDRGVHVVGLFDHGAGMGRQYLTSLGLDQVMPASTAPAELLALLTQVNPRHPSRTNTTNWPVWPGRDPLGGPKRGRGLLSAWTKVSGGTGLSEAVIAASEYLTKGARVLLVEAEEVAPVLVSRLVRSPEAGLPWAVSRAGQGLRALPEGLSGARDDGTAPLGHFDVICAPPSAAHVISPSHLTKLLAEAVGSYDYVLVETSWLVGTPSSRERFSAARAVLQKADSVVVFASADPEGAARLVQWKAAALAAGVAAPCWAVFGRARKGRYETDHLRNLVVANTGHHRFSGFGFLPEDQTVARSRWNAEMVWKGAWLRSVRELVGSSMSPALRVGPSSPVTGPPAAIVAETNGKTTGVMAP